MKTEQFLFTVKSSLHSQLNWKTWPQSRGKTPCGFHAAFLPNVFWVVEKLCKKLLNLAVVQLLWPRYRERKLKSIKKRNFLALKDIFLTSPGCCLTLASSLDVVQVRPRLYGEKLSRVEGSPAYPSYPGRANLSYISLQNLANRLHEKQKVGSARRVTRLAGSPFCDGRVTLLAGPTFLHINTLARSAGTTPRKLKSVFYLENEHCGLNCYQRS